MFSETGVTTPEQGKSDRGDQRHFWDEEAPTATFSHPLDTEWLDRIVGSQSRILDYGCGYGRTMVALRELGFTDVTGLDVSKAMLARARLKLPFARLVFADALPSPLEDASFDLVILFAVLTSIPEDERQRAVVEDISRLLRPGGYLYVSDLPLQSDTRRVARYGTARPVGLPYGSFEIDGGRAVMRHHTDAWFDELFTDFLRVEEKSGSVATMRGQTADAIQFLLQKPPR